MPENKEEQIDALCTTLLGNAVFGRVRGTMNRSLTGFLDDCIDRGNPTAALRTWDERLSDLRVMLNMLAKFRRDGWTFAEMELKRALVDRKYTLPGETVPLEQTGPFTIFMVDPETTFAVHKFLMDWLCLLPDFTFESYDQPDFWMEYRKKEFCDGRYGPALWPLLNEVSWELCDRPVALVGQYFTGPEVIFLTVMHAFKKRLKNIKSRRVGQRTLEFHPWGHNERAASRNRSRAYAQLAGNSRGYGDTACLFGKANEQSEVLSAFTREDQQRIASWQFHLPSAIIGGRRVYAVCLRPEAEHARWLKERPQFTSRGVTHGYCAVLIPIDSLGQVFRGQFPTSLILFHNSTTASFSAAPL